MIDGIAPAAIVSCAVCGSTSIFALITRQSHGGWLSGASSRSSGPAFTGVIIANPNGAPS